MPNTLLLRLRGPMQSWGVSSRFSIRDTGKEPSKSGVIGLLCAALGISRDDANKNNPLFEELGKLKMGVRVLREGIMQKDYHTAQNVRTADGKSVKPTELSTRWYLADADFVVGLENEDASFLGKVHESLQRPKWQLFLGRKAFPAALPVHFREGVFSDTTLDLLKDERLNDVLQIYEEELQLEPADETSQRIIIEDPNGEDVRQDVPLDFAARSFTIRRVRTEFIKIKGEESNGNISDKDDPESAMPAGST